MYNWGVLALPQLVCSGLPESVSLYGRMGRRLEQYVCVLYL